MHKKVSTIIFVITITVLLTACGSSSSSGRSEKATSSQETETSQNIDNEISYEESDTTKEISSDNNTADNTSFEEITVVDNSECTVKITGIDPDNLWGYTLKAYLENKSIDKTYMYSVTTASINGVKCDPFFATEVAAGKKSNNDISFSTSTLEENGITDFTDIEISFKVYDSNDWMADAVAEETAHIYPYGAENAVVFNREAQSTDTVLFDNEYVTVIVTGYEEDNIWGYTANLYLVNKTDVEVMFSVNDSSVNGYMVDPFYAESVTAGKSTISSISWSNTALEENGITEVSEIEMTFRIYDANDWMADDFVNERVILNP